MILCQSATMLILKLSRIFWIKIQHGFKEYSEEEFKQGYLLFKLLQLYLELC